MIPITAFLSDHQVDFERLEAKEASVLVGRWEQTFAKNVKKVTGQWVHERFRWHGFSYGYEQARSGADALSDYLAQWPADFIIFDEALNWCYQCQAQQYPDLSPLDSDIYVAHHNMKWTMAFTHEQPDLGPYFATRSFD